MARYTGPKHRLCRREGTPLCGNAECPVLTRQIPPGGLGKSGERRRRRKASEYFLQLREKQKVKRIYGVLERQFRRYVREAKKERQGTGAAILALLERRLDNVVYRLGFAKTRTHARQIVNHGHVRVDGKRVDIPSFTVDEAQIIELEPDIVENVHVKDAMTQSAQSPCPAWLERKGLAGKIARLPIREDSDSNIQEQYIVEFYSR